MSEALHVKYSKYLSGITCVNVSQRIVYVLLFFLFILSFLSLPVSELIV